MFAIARFDVNPKRHPEKSAFLSRSPDWRKRDGASGSQGVIRVKTRHGVCRAIAFVRAFEMYLSNPMGKQRTYGEDVVVVLHLGSGFDG